MGDRQLSRKQSSDEPCEFDSHPFRLMCALGRAALGASLPSWKRGFRFPQGTLLDRGSASGRLPDFESGDGGSNPPPRTEMQKLEFTPGQLLLVVTLGSEPGGRWFDSNPRN